MFSRTRTANLRESAEGTAHAPWQSPAASNPAVLANDHDLDRVYKQHFAFVWRSLRRLGVPQEALDDAAQDVFIIALRRATEFRGRSSYGTWLFGIAANVAREQRRKGRRASALEPLEDAILSPQPSPLEQATDAEAVRFIEAFLATLDDAKREVFILAELEQMAAPEIAEAVGAKLNTVYSRLRAAREAFVDMMRQRSGGEP
jgi:RNA polymerase sigma-70 factor (ECF subfamily)